MKELVVLSGKGGTGKTAVAAALCHLAAGDDSTAAVAVDADVDAANLELVLGGRRLDERPFQGGWVATVDPERCAGCGLCLDACRFDAIAPADSGWAYRVDPLACEGCAACVHECPEEAIRMVSQVVGFRYRSETRGGAPFHHARLLPARENSGKLVATVKEEARASGRRGGWPLMIVDGPPGIGCPAIASSSGADLALIVTEPTAAGLHDLVRTLEMTAHFGLRSAVCINKSDLHPEGALAIEEACRARRIPVLPSVPFDDAVPRAMAAGLPVTEMAPGSPAAAAIRRVWGELRELLRATDARG
jgi:MinD superfamily P-loop ATPase